jgi:biotin synthase
MTELTQPDILRWLRETQPDRLQELYDRADRVRRQNVGDAVHLRGLIEISSHCARQCMYCGLRRGNHTLARYRMTRDEILDCARQAEALGYGTVVMQAGEDSALTTEFITDIVRCIKRETALAVTLSLGERQDHELQSWRSAGADRYLLRFETSDPELFRRIHPRAPAAPDRLTLLARLKQIGYEAGGGVMVGIPGQSYANLANDVLTFRALDLDMIGIGPYIPHDQTPLGSGALLPDIDPGEQAPATEEMVYKMVALARITCPTANIPSTTALATINKTHGRKRALSVGANVVMPNLTPVKYRSLYQIYPAKACIDESAADCNQCLRGQIHSLGRFAGRGPGGRGPERGGPRSGEIEPAPTAAVNPQLVQLQVHHAG